MKALRNELNRTHKNTFFIKGDVTIIDILLAKSGQLRELSILHMEALNKFRRQSSHLIFPALHKELFSIDQPDQKSFENFFLNFSFVCLALILFCFSRKI